MYSGVREVQAFGVGQKPKGTFDHRHFKVPEIAQAHCKACMQSEHAFIVISAAEKAPWHVPELLVKECSGFALSENQNEMKDERQHGQTNSQHVKSHPQCQVAGIHGIVDCRDQGVADNHTQQREKMSEATEFVVYGYD